MKPALLDVNLLLALAWPNHQHHVAARTWFLGLGDRPWRTCAATQAGFVRLSANPAYTLAARPPEECIDLLLRLVAIGRHEFLAEQPSVSDMAFQGLWPGVTGHRPVPDLWLIATARRHDAVLATLDGRLARAVHVPGVIELVNA